MLYISGLTILKIITVVIMVISHIVPLNTLIESGGSINVCYCNCFTNKAKSAGGGLGGLRMTKSVNEMATVSPNGSALITVNEPATEPSPFSIVT